MASRSLAARSFIRRFSSGGKILSEEEKAAENVYIKKVEQEKLAKKGVSAQAAAQDTKVPPAAESVNTAQGSDTRISTDKNRNYAVLAGTVAIVSGLGWYLLSKPKKADDEIQH